jgi:3-hydroxybutyrate dehydrogenase
MRRACRGSPSEGCRFWRYELGGAALRQKRVEEGAWGLCMQRVTRMSVMDDLSGLQGRSALITGGASGIGAAIARRLAGLGVAVQIVDLDLAGARAVAAETRGEAWQLDLSDPGALRGVELEVDILVNNAGIQRVSPIEELDPDVFHRMLMIMVEAPFRLIRSALPYMYAHGYGRIVNVSSVHGLRASAYKSAYVTAKHALEGLSKVTALEGGSHGVTSNCVNPGYVRTPLVEQQIADQARIHRLAESAVLETIMLTHNAVKRLVEPEEVAALVGWLVGPEAAMVTGASYTMDGGWTAQ